MLVVVVLLVGLLFVMRPRRRADVEHEHETLNPDVDAADEGAPLEGTGGERLVGNPPVDTVTQSGSGTAVPGTGAGGPTDDSHDPLRRAPGDASDSPDQR
jgi:hypothetical protein